jgi:hypothetical protein
VVQGVGLRYNTRTGIEKAVKMGRLENQKADEQKVRNPNDKEEKKLTHVVDRKGNGKYT